MNGGKVGNRMDEAKGFCKRYFCTEIAIVKPEANAGFSTKDLNNGIFVFPPVLKVRFALCLSMGCL